MNIKNGNNSDDNVHQHHCFPQHCQQLFHLNNPQQTHGSPSVAVILLLQWSDSEVIRTLDAITCNINYSMKSVQMAENRQIVYKRRPWKQRVTALRYWTGSELEQNL